MNVAQNQPFGLPIEVTWLLGILIPILIAMSGWFVVFILNKNHLLHEKRIIIKIHAFDYIKNNINGLVISGKELYSFIFNSKTTFERFTPDNTLYKYDKERLLKEFSDDIFNKLKDKFSNNFCEFINVWEQYEIVLKSIVIKRYALQEEFKLVLDELSSVWIKYMEYLSNLKNNISTSDESRAQLASSLTVLFTHVLYLTCCIGDVRNSLQDFVFGDVLKDNNDKRVVKGSDIPTIETLIKKHFDALKKYYGIKLNKKLSKQYLL
ncbi:MAG: hypothetical protein PHC69_05295 [Ruminiclostridium sp.]|nr:hypothetical protein [Ruminiclostridium sp.]